MRVEDSNHFRGRCCANDALQPGLTPIVTSQRLIEHVPQWVCVRTNEAAFTKLSRELKEQKTVHEATVTKLSRKLDDQKRKCEATGQRVDKLELGAAAIDAKMAIDAVGGRARLRKSKVTAKAWKRLSLSRGEGSGVLPVEVG